MSYKILIVGGTGAIGSKLVAALNKQNHSVVGLSRSKNAYPGMQTIQWNPAKKQINGVLPEHIDAVINLAGAPIAGKRWNKSYKQKILRSRVDSTEFLHALIRQSNLHPNIYVGASAIGYYGNSGNHFVDETNKPSSTFIGKTVEKWEHAHQAGKKLYNRMVILRIGLVLMKESGVLAKVIPAGKLGVFQYFGKGDIFQSWIHIDDLVHIFLLSIDQFNLDGVYNAVAPFPVTGRVFSNELKKAMGYHGISLPVPYIPVRIGIGEIAKILFDSCRASSGKIRKAGYQFAYPTLEDALHNIIGQET
jgi:uncharacterized protein (TIGR01777 family)